MALEKVFGKRVPDGEIVTLTGSEFQFSVGAVEKNDLAKFSYIRLAVDQTAPRIRIYFGFETKAHEEAIKFYSQPNRSARKMCSASGVYSRYPAIKRIQEKKKREDRRFELLKVSERNKGVYPEFTHFIQL